MPLNDCGAQYVASSVAVTHTRGVRGNVGKAVLQYEESQKNI